MLNRLFASESAWGLKDLKCEKPSTSQAVTSAIAITASVTLSILSVAARFERGTSFNRSNRAATTFVAGIMTGLHSLSGRRKARWQMASSAPTAWSCIRIVSFWAWQKGMKAPGSAANTLRCRHAITRPSLRIAGGTA